MAKESLVLLPGVFADAELWDDQIRALRAIVEPMPISLNVADTIAGLAEQVLWTAPPRFNLACLSLGGHVAMEIVRRAPERIVRLALLNFHARPEPPEKVRLRKEWAQRTLSGQYAAVVDELAPCILESNEPALAERVKAMAWRCGARGFLSINQAMQARPDSRPTLPKVACPTLVIGGRQDRVVPLSEVEEVATGIVGAQLLVLDNCGHLAPLEQPRAVAEAMRNWLGKGVFV